MNREFSIRTMRPKKLCSPEPNFSPRIGDFQPNLSETMKIKEPKQGFDKSSILQKLMVLCYGGKALSSRKVEVTMLEYA